MNYLITDYKNENSIYLKVDGLIINSSLYSTFNDENSFSLKEIREIVPKIKETEKICICNCDRIIPELEIDRFVEFINEIINLCDYIIYSDFAILSSINKSDYNKLIYDSKTLVCSSKELESIPTKAFLSSELSLNEIMRISKSNVSYSIDVFGYRQIMYSRRPILSLIMPFNKVKVNNVYDFKEETRKEHYKIIERKFKDNYGTFIYNYGIYVLYKELLDLKNNSNILFIRINSLFISNIIKEVCEIYYDLINNNIIDIDNLNELLNDNSLSLDRAFLDRESILLKDETNEKD